MTFEEWWDAPKTVKQITASTKDIAQQAYQAGRESMRQECVRVCEALSERWPDEGGDARGCLHSIRNLK